MLNNSIKSLTPRQFLMARTGTYHTQHLRSWNITGNVRDVNNLATHIARTGSVAVSPDLISKAAPGMMAVSLDHQGAVPIASGWGEERAIFVLMFTVEYNAGVSVDWIVQGYTDFPAFAKTSIDPNMVFFVNNVFALNQTTVTMGGVTGMRANLMADYQLLGGFAGGTMGQPTGNLLIRPSDIFANISYADLAGHAQVIDSSQLANVGVQTSRHTNNIANTMLADTINAWHAASMETDVVQSTGAIADVAYAKQMETAADQDLFLSLISRHNNGGPASSFRAGALLKAMPEVMRVYTSTERTGAGDVRWSTTGDSDPMGGQALEHFLAVNVQASLPSIMVESMLATLSFSVTNATVTSGFDATMDSNHMRPHYTRHASNGFVPQLTEQGWQQFCRRFERDILTLIPPGKAYYMTVTCSFHREIDIYIKLDREVRFVAPAFCNALLAPVQTTSYTDAQEFATTFETMITDVNEALMESQIRRANGTNKMMESALPARQNSAFQMPRHATAPQALNIPPAPGSGLAGSMTGQPQPAYQPQQAGSMLAGMSGGHNTGGQPPVTGTGSMTAGLGR